MNLLRVEGIRYIIFCVSMLILAFVDFLNMSAFFVLGAGFVFLNYILGKRGFNKDYSNIYFNLFYVAFTIFTVLLINITVGWS